jgi:hypothetical protein
MPIIMPDKAALREAFDAAVREIDTQRERPMLTNEFYADIGTSVFEAGYEALQDFAGAQAGATAKPRLHVVSAPAGSGKTSFSVALLAALVRLTAAAEGEPLGCLFLTDQRERADATYRELAELLPGKVAVWTSEHDLKRTVPERERKVTDPAARFTVDQLAEYPVVVTTQAFFQGPRGVKAREWLVNGRKQPRALTLVDERPNEVTVFEALLSEAEQVREYIQADEENRDTIEPHISTLVRFMQSRTHRSSDLEKPTDDTEAWEVSNDLQWFRTEAATRYAKEAAARYAKQNGGKSLPISQVFGFARSVAEGYAFVARSHGGKGGTRFIGYQSDLVLDHGMVLLDATADIDGIQQVITHRVLQPTPRAHYGNLEIVHVASLTREKLSTFLTHAKNRRDYTAWMRSVIIEHMEPGQRGLVVCKKSLFDNENVPGDLGGTPTDDPVYTINIEGRALAFIHWGHGIGSNLWKDADVVFLFDEFFKPRRIVISDTQALRRHKATEGDLATMKTQNTRAPAVDVLSEGHLLRWSKQMCLRGRARCFDEHGLCGTQKLVCSGDRQRLLRNAQVLFPGAKVTLTKADTGAKQNRADALLALLSDPALPNVVTTNWIGQQFKKPFREFADVIKSNSVKDALAGLGWRYVSQRGKGGSRFERIERRRVDSRDTETTDTSHSKAPLDVVLAVRAITKAANTVMAV